jgi:hypothetical protein
MHNDEYRAQLIKAVEVIRAKAATEEARRMSDDQLTEVICSNLGLPTQTLFTDEQLEMIAKHR